MSKRLQLRYVRELKDGRFKYRRVLSGRLARVLRANEYTRALGRTEREVLANYSAIHSEFERLKELAERQSDIESPSEIEAWVASIFEANNLDLHSPGKTDDEQTARDAEADRVEVKYRPYASEDPRELMGHRDRAYVDALRGGWGNVDLPCTVNMAFDLYLKEKRKPDSFLQEKQEKRIGRVKAHLFDVIKVDLPLENVRKSHARKVRDRLIQGRAPGTVRRMINDLKAVFNFAIQEFEIEGKQNPFSKLEIPAPKVTSIDARSPLPDTLIQKIYEELDFGSLYFDVWTTSHHTGAIASEILGLKSKDVRETEAGLAISIEPNEIRGVKQIVRERTIR
ncbi:hypothetical protein [Maritimibacter dapengensis]|uniref:Core-binding (CB) domain-containing protein n=1 Tax=Maritimibacter dapengensis TaxID=2836868 RepID=A0ABS6T355_9RHOB|nr:hypothetical protein [Maritimibacter dapengensis]MBV7379689.1 hypothetical protein [Maritimibacter dapengensis]